jgi:hypothetical protein
MCVSLDGQWFNYGLKLPQNLAEIDSYLYSRLRRRFNAIEKKRVRATVLVDTEKAKSFDAHVETELTWPRLFSHPVVHFPLTSVGNFSVSHQTLHSSYPIKILCLDTESHTFESINSSGYCSTPTFGYLS